MALVVDDAIVVVEAVEHHIELGLSPRDAAIKGDGSGRGPSSPWAWFCRRFIPCAFMSGSSANSSASLP